MLRIARSSLLRRGACAAAGCVAAGAAVSSLASQCEAAQNTVSAVDIIERPRQQWIEVEQQELADSFVDFANPDTAYVEALRALRSAYYLPVSAMASLRDFFLAEAEAGLKGVQTASLRMLPTYVTSRVTGSERGDYYALDLGGTNFRVLRLTLLGDGKVGPVTQSKFTVPQHIKQGSAEELFGFLADSVATFLATQCGGNPSGKLGFTFSFPTDQSAIDEGKLVVWNKDFAASGCIGEDVVGLLRRELVARGIMLEVQALANDTVGTMEAAAYAHPSTAMGVILGTGTNAAYIERGANVTKWRGPPCDEMVINTEWGNLDAASVMNVYDAAIDAASANPTLQRFEKMISGMYLGELCRVSVTSPEVLPAFSEGFAGALQSAFGERMSLPSSLMAAIEADTSADLRKAAAALAAAGVPHSTLRDRVLMREACVGISTRAARLAAVGIVSLLAQMGGAGGSGGATVAVDGTVFECYPYFKERMEFGVELLLGKAAAAEVDLLLAKDGSGVGAAIIAAIARPQ